MKRSAFTVCMGFAAMLLVAGCSGARELSSSLGDASGLDGVTAGSLKVVKNKTTQNEVMAALGAPSLVFKNDIGGESWVYQRIAVRQSNVGFAASANFEAIFPYKADTKGHGGGFAGVGAAAALDSNRSTYKSAGLLINYNAEGCVNNYEFTATSF